MKRVTALVGITVLAALTGCAKKEAPQVHEDDEAAAATATQPEPAAATPATAKDRSKVAVDMIAFIDAAPQCQQYRDQLEATGSTPGPVDEMSVIYVQAHKAGCVIKKQKQ